MIINEISLIVLLESGSHLSSRAVSRQVLSAVCGLTVVFGMGTGVSHNRIATGNSLATNTFKTKHTIQSFPSYFGQALGLLVSVSLTRYRAYTPDLSTL